MLIAAGSLLAGGGILLRAYFIEHPIQLSAPEPIKQLFENQPVQIQGVSTELTPQSEDIWGAEISNELNLPSNSPWLIVNIPGQRLVGELVESDFVQLTALPVSSTLLKIFENKSLIYVLPSNNVSDAGLYGYFEKETELLTSLQPGWEFDSVYYSADAGAFYYVAINGSTRKLFKLIPTLPAREIYNFDDQDDYTLLAIDAAAQLAYLASNATEFCYVLNLETKSIELYSCDLVKSDYLNHTLRLSPENVTELGSDVQNQVLRINRTNGTEITVLETEQGQLITGFVADSESIGLVIGEVQAIGEETEEDDIESDQAAQVYAFEEVSLRVLELLTGDLKVEYELSDLGGGSISSLALTPKLVPYIVLDQVALYIFTDSAWVGIDLPDCEQSCTLELINFLN